MPSKRKSTKATAPVSKRRKSNKPDSSDSEDDASWDEGESSKNAKPDVQVTANRKRERNDTETKATESKTGLKKGEWIWLMKDNPPTQICAWHDSGMCLTLSTRHHVQGGQVQRRMSGVKGKITRECPQMIVDYNRYMGGVDRADALRAHLTVIRRCKKWWHALMYWIFDTALINSQILYESSFGKVDRHDFLHAIVDQLTDNSGTKAEEEPIKVSNNLKKSQGSFWGHWPNEFEKRSNCIVCRRRDGILSSTFYRCIGCVKPPCLHPECFQEYHENEEMYRRKSKKN